MKLLTIPPPRLKHANMEGAFDAVFGPDMVRRVHGSSTRVGSFHNGKRAFSFKVDVSNIPPPIRRFFCGKELAITTRQTLEKEAQVWNVKNKLKLHFVGAELFKLKPEFWLSNTSDGIFLGGTVQHNAMLPPPLNGIAESFMMLNSERELVHFANCLQQSNVIE